jgi:hypothetical protein
LNRINFSSLSEPDEGRLDAFVCDNKHGIISIDNGAFMTACILDIGASKYFVPVSQKSDSKHIIINLLNAFKEFTADSF